MRANVCIPCYEIDHPFAVTIDYYQKLQGLHGVMISTLKQRRDENIRQANAKPGDYLWDYFHGEYELDAEEIFPTQSVSAYVAALGTALEQTMRRLSVYVSKSRPCFSPFRVSGPMSKSIQRFLIANEQPALSNADIDVVDSFSLIRNCIVHDARYPRENDKQLRSLIRESQELEIESDGYLQVPFEYIDDIAHRLQTVFVALRESCGLVNPPATPLGETP